MMMIAALLALAAAAVAGIFLATRHFMRKRLPAWVALLHGLGGATGFAFVLLTVVREPTFRPIRDVLYLLIATVVLGAVNLLFHIRRVRHRTSLILIHGLTAVSAAAMLIRAIVVHMELDEARAAAAQPSATAPAAVASAPQSAEPSADAGTAPSAGTAAASASEKAAAAEPPSDTFVVDESVKRALDRPINFETNSAEISQDSQSAIAEMASVLKAHPEVGLIEVQGHADERGGDGKNIGLTRTRAAAVVDALVASGVGRERLHSAGYGSRCPDDPACRASDAPASCHDSSNWQRDRRVVFLVLQVGKASYRGEVVCARGAELIPPQDRRFHVRDATR